MTWPCFTSGASCPVFRLVFVSILDDRVLTMCGRFTSTASPEELMRLFGVTVMDNLQPRWNVAPSQTSLVITQTGLQPEAIFPAWGLPPDARQRSFLINARMETAAEKPTFHDAFMHRRCLVVTSGWFEWSAPKKPWHVQLCDGGVMAFGGLLLRRGDGDRFVVMTSAANGDLATIHHRLATGQMAPLAEWRTGRRRRPMCGSARQLVQLVPGWTRCRTGCRGSSRTGDTA